MDQNRVLFDTSVVRGKHNIFASKFPKPEWIWVISETTDLELNRQAKDSHIRTSIFLKSQEYEPLVPRGEVLKKEIQAYSLGNKLDPGEAIQNDSYRNMRLQALNDPFALEKLKRRVKIMEFSSEYFWKMIKVGENNRFNSGDVRFDFDDNNLLTLSNGTKILDLLRSDFENFSALCPSCYNFCLFLAFISAIQKPKDAEKGFTVIVNDKKLQLTRTYVQDMVIALPYLHYVDKFCTSDNGQAAILTQLYPQYSERIEVLK